MTVVNGTSSTLGTINLVNGIASLTVTTLPVGSNSVSAAYNGDANDSTSNAALAAPIVVILGVTIIPDSYQVP